VQPIWAVYLTEFVERYGTSRPERVRDMFEDAVRRAPSELKKTVFLWYAKFEEFGLAGRAMKVYEDAANAGCLQPRLDRRFYIFTTCTSNR
jgi:pre-mRNA-splicing factor SYF1